MKYNQTQQLVTGEYDMNTNIWTLHILNTVTGLKEAIQNIKKVLQEQKLTEKEDEIITIEEAYIKEVYTFISTKYC